MKSAKEPKQQATLCTAEYGLFVAGAVGPFSPIFFAGSNVGHEFSVCLHQGAMEICTAGATPGLPHLSKVCYCYYRTLAVCRLACTQRRPRKLRGEKGWESRLTGLGVCWRSPGPGAALAQLWSARSRWTQLNNLSNGDRYLEKLEKEPLKTKVWAAC